MCLDDETTASQLYVRHGAQAQLTYHTEVQDIARLDFSWECLLSDSSVNTTLAKLSPWCSRANSSRFSLLGSRMSCSIQLETHRRQICRKIGEPPKNELRLVSFYRKLIDDIRWYFPRAKHPVKVHVWAGMSMRGRTGICIFKGIMNASVYADILNRTLVLLGIASCKTMTLNTPLDWVSASWQTTTSHGERLLLNCQT